MYVKLKWPLCIENTKAIFTTNQNYKCFNYLECIDKSNLIFTLRFAVLINYLTDLAISQNMS